MFSPKTPQGSLSLSYISFENKSPWQRKLPDCPFCLLHSNCIACCLSPQYLAQSNITKYRHSLACFPLSVLPQRIWDPEVTGWSVYWVHSHPSIIGIQEILSEWTDHLINLKSIAWFMHLYLQFISRLFEHNKLLVSHFYIVGY